MLIQQMIRVKESAGERDSFVFVWIDDYLDPPSNDVEYIVSAEVCNKYGCRAYDYPLLIKCCSTIEEAIDEFRRLVAYYTVKGIGLENERKMGEIIRLLREVGYNAKGLYGTCERDTLVTVLKEVRVYDGNGYVGLNFSGKSWLLSYEDNTYCRDLIIKILEDRNIPKLLKKRR